MLIIYLSMKSIICISTNLFVKSFINHRHQRTKTITGKIFWLARQKIVESQSHLLKLSYNFSGKFVKFVKNIYIYTYSSRPTCSVYQALLSDFIHLTKALAKRLDVFQAENGVKAVKLCSVIFLGGRYLSIVSHCGSRHTFFLKYNVLIRKKINK